MYPKDFLSGVVRLGTDPPDRLKARLQAQLFLTPNNLKRWHKSIQMQPVI
jgi:hypothetical protein